ncbi:CRISPR-associated endonuclease Cas4g/Cas1g [Frigoriglobus tundricola]|uniref:CRISPR-associated endonuclease Cas1 n=1 Tax=Frigoriglobus tundricola TaxID=2774151 RepID=A0A6M5YKR6_9BACT|nr:CRISPR-associated endonuclease Cas1 [Frigoriglobus tundricola]QJW94164.1 CRISPR-associated protein Cas1 [Frigoriglobus tundricola]
MSATTDPIPVRALNQVTYCPRLYFLQYVDCVMPVNEHVEGGLFDHRRVDSGDLKNKTRTDRGTATSRGIALSSEALGISGILDVIEEKNGEQYPVETKHGKAPHDDDGKPTIWDNDAVQLCAQALLMEEAFGQPVPRGYQFHAGSRERVPLEFTDALRQKTQAAITRCRELQVLDAPPEPLPAELRHRCFGCSLASVCQPEEILYQIGHPNPADADAPSAKTLPDVRLVIPRSDNGAVLYLQEPGSSVGKRSEHLVIKKDGKEMNRVPLHAVRQVVVCGNVQVSTQALETMAENEIGVSYVTGHGRFIGSFVPAPAKNVSLREAQFRKFSDPAACLELSKSVVRAKLANQRTLLMRTLRGEEEARGSHEPAAKGIYGLLAGLDRVTSVESVLGTEGQGAALYFGEFGRFLKQPPTGKGFDFTTRNRRPPRDPVNALLSFAYAMLAKDCFAAVCTVGFDPYKGFFHQGRHGKPSLALDLMEEFRPVIADSVVLTLINNESLTPADFIIWRDACNLTDAGRKAFFAAYEQRKSAEVTHPVYGYRMSYARMLEVQARMLAAFVRGEIPTYTGFMVR